MITIVTLDGPAGVGKTTIARQLADRLGIAYLDTGAMFRSVALFFGEGSWEKPVDQLVPELNRLDFDLEGEGSHSELLLNGYPLSPDIRSEEVGLWASHLARIPVVRDFLRRNQQAIGRIASLVAEGRDMGSVVFPTAKHKFFMDASIDVRAKRRHAQLKAMHGRGPGTHPRSDPHPRRPGPQSRGSTVKTRPGRHDHRHQRP